MAPINIGWFQQRRDSRERVSDVHTNVHMRKGPAGLGLVNVVNIVNVFRVPATGILENLECHLFMDTVYRRVGERFTMVT